MIEQKYGSDYLWDELGVRYLCVRGSLRFLYPSPSSSLPLLPLPPPSLTSVKGQKDSPFASQCCDIIQGVVVDPIDFSPTKGGDGEETTDPWFVPFIDCTNAILSNPASPPILIVCAVAFAKLFAKAVANSILLDQVSILFHTLKKKSFQILIKTDNIPYSVVQHLNSLLNAELPRVISLQTFILKQLRSQLSVQQIRERCEEDSFINMFPWSGKEFIT
jgi:hypothetical protein